MSNTLLAKEEREKARLEQELQRKNAELEREKSKEQRIAEKDGQLALLQEANQRKISQLQGQLQTQNEELKQFQQKVKYFLSCFLVFFLSFNGTYLGRSRPAGWRLLSYSSSFRPARLFWPSFSQGLLLVVRSVPQC